MKNLFRAVVCAAALAGCRGSGSGGEEAATSVLVPVGTAVIVRDSMPEEVAVVGVLRPSPGHAALLTAPVAGLVAGTPVQVGDRVAVGDLLVNLDAPELAAAANRSALAAEVAEHDARRQQALLDEGVTARRTVEEKEAVARSARADATADAALLSRAAVRSPVAGEVQRIFVQPGERVDVGAPLAEVVDRSSLDLVGAVPAAVIGRLRHGQSALVLAEGSVIGVAGLVHAVAPALDSASHSGQVIIRVLNPGRLPAGVGATALVRVGLLRDVLVVADSALVVVGDSQTIFVIGGDSVAHARAVRVVARREGRAAVNGDVKAGDIAVTTGAWGLADGMRVAPATPAP
jgi:RND family efflux transporter MFP subunit